MTIEALLADLERRGVRLRAGEDKLRLSDPRHALAEDDLTRLRRHKPEILALLAGRPCCGVCGYALIEEPTNWWGLDPCHRDCGLRAWRRHWGADAAEGQA
jgi:hypothetical protein